MVILCNLLCQAQDIAQNYYKRGYRVISRELPFNKLVKSKKYAIVLFYKYKKETDNILTQEERQRYAQLAHAFNELSNDPTYKNRKDLVFIMVNTALPGGQEIFMRYSTAPLPSYLILHDGKELKSSGQTYLLPASTPMDQIKHLLNKVLE
jgi:hypothetical protein